MTKFRFKRKRLWKSLLVTLTLGTTLPVLALLCRGHSPSRYEVRNLPVWERGTPAAPKPLGRLAAVPLSPSAVRFATLPMADALANADESRMFANLEVVRHLPSDRLSAGKAGVWLEQACVLGRWDADLQPKVDRVAARLMNAEDYNGYLGAFEPAHTYTAQDIAAHSNNLRGLLSYYASSRQPAALNSGIRAGNFLLENYDPWPGNEESGAEDSLVYALTRLYLACGDPKYLRFAEREEATRGSDGLGLCALYEATGSREYLRLAERAWAAVSAKAVGSSRQAHNQATPQFSAEIYKITADPMYLAGLAEYRATSVWPVSIAYTRGASGLSINCLYPAEVHLGPVRLAVGQALRSTPANGNRVAVVRSIAFSRGGRLRAPLSPVKIVETQDLSVTTNAHTPSLVHITLQPGCIAVDPDHELRMTLNGKLLKFDTDAGARLALRPINPAARKALPAASKLTVDS